jgi:hypothetical protein
METLFSLVEIVLMFIQLFCYEFLMVLVKILVHFQLGLLRIAMWILGGEWKEEE